MCCRLIIDLQIPDGCPILPVVFVNITEETILEVNAVWPNGIPEVGQTTGRSRKVQPRDIELFTDISGDRNPLHYDEEIARKSRFDGIVVQGGVTSAILNAVVSEDLSGPGTVFLQVNWRFLAPVRPGDTITGVSRSVPTNPSPKSIPASRAVTVRLFWEAMRSVTPSRSSRSRNP